MNHNIVDAVPMPEPTPKRPTPGVGLNLPPLRRLNAPVQPPSAQMPPVAQPPQQQPPMPPVDFNQLPEFFRRDDPYRLNPSAVQLQREMLLREIGPLTLPSLERFVQVLFNDDLVVESYIRPKPLHGRVGRTFKEGGVYLEAHPWREAKRAARWASMVKLLDDYPYEAEFISVAAWALPAGLFVLSHPSAQAKGEGLQDLAQARQMTAHLVRDAISAMSTINVTHARVMNALIGQGGHAGCGPRQLGRLFTALYLSQAKINAHWVPASGWPSAGRDDNDTADIPN